MDKNGEIEMPVTVFNTYLGYISEMIEATNSKNSYKELADLLPIECTDEEKEKWFYQTLAYVAALNLTKFTERK